MRVFTVRPTHSAVLRFLLLITSLMLMSCATAVPSLVYRSGALPETVSSPVSLTVHSLERSLGASGYLVYRSPDKLHLVVLSPFGTTMFEAFALGDRITLVYPSKSTAFTGRYDELPEKDGIKGWSLMRWVMDTPPPDPAHPDGTFVMKTPDGREKETVTFRQGVVTAKQAPNGDLVEYSDYTVVDGVPLAREIIMRNSSEDRIRIVLQEPEVNTPLEDAVFTPRLDGITVLPLSFLSEQ